MPSDYSNIVESLTDYYGASSAQVWDVINQYNLTPAQAAELLPQQTIASTADGVYRLYNNAGDVTGYVNQVTVSTAQTASNVASAVNSNAQTGTAATTVQTRWAGNSVIDQNGKIQTSPGVTRYEGGVAQQSSLPAVVGNVAAASAAVATGISLGKAIDSRLYNANPAFWNSLGLNTLDPATWNTLTADMADTGFEGAAKAGINFLLGLKPDGSTQAYMPADAFDYMAWALAKQGVFDVAGSEGTYPSSLTQITPDYWNNPYTVYTGPIYTASGHPNTGYGEQVVEITPNGSTPVYILMTSYDTPSRVYKTRRLNMVSREQFAYTRTYYYYNDPAHANPQHETGILIPRTIDGVTWYYGNSTLFGGSELEQYILANHRMVDIGSTAWWQDSTTLIANSTIHTGEAKEGVTDQTGATVPTGIDENSSLQDVSSAIQSQYPDLHDNRVEQTVVQPDGTIKTIVYYPVPMPNDTTDVSVPDPVTITIDQPITVVLPDGATITLPDGSVIHGDGSTPVELPANTYNYNTYTLPSNTIIKNQYIYNTYNTQGGSQTDTTVDDSSTTELKNLIIDLITSIGLLPQTVTAPDTTTDTDTPTEDTNPPDTGDGSTPPIVVPVGSASALWSVYNPTLAQVNQLGAWLWSNNFIDQLLKMFNDPMQAIIGLHATFIQPTTGSTQNIKVGYLDSGVSSLTVPTQYSSMDCGSVDLQEYFGNVFDYSPYTRVYIYLPFIGFKELDVSQVMRSRIGVKYHGDAYTGTGLCEVTVTRDAGAGGVLYSYGCECAVRYPLSQGSYMGMVGAIAGTALGIASGNIAPALLGFMNARMDVDHSGGFSGNSGAMGIKKPYLVIMRPQTAMANNYKHFTGAPSNANVKVGSCSGYIRCKEVHVEGLSAATNEEKTMVENALKTGIIVS